MGVHYHEAVLPYLVPIDTVKPWPDNPRSGDLAALKESIRKNGFYQPIVVQKTTGFVLAGNHRLQALQEMGATEVPVVIVDVDDIQAKRLALVDNRTSDLAFYDDQQLFKLLQDMVEQDSLEGTGYDRAAFELLLQGTGGDSVTGGIRQGLIPGERLDEYNQLDVRSIILPYDGEEYEVVATAFTHMRQALFVDTNAEVAKILLQRALEEVEIEP
jgi:hypothetical protein